MSPIATETKPKSYMTIEELAEYFGVCTKTIANWKRDGLLVYIQVELSRCAAEGSWRRLHYWTPVI